MSTPLEAIMRMREDAHAVLLGADSLDALERFRVDFLGRNGKVTAFLSSVAHMPAQERRAAGMEGNALRGELEHAYAAKREGFGGATEKKRAQGIDISRPGARVRRGHIHVISKTLADFRRIFTALGFSVVDGPEAEREWYNFDALNIPKDHPARDAMDTFWLRQQVTGNSKQKTAKEGLLLRTHTSNVQVRFMETHEPPLRIVSPGRCFRRDATDATHDVQFHQMEALWVDRGVSVANFKYIVEELLSAFFNKPMRVRLRPAYFPFVEPGFEIDMTCVRCGGKKCTLCKTGWVEVLAAGMVNQKVFTAAGYVPGAWKGMAFAVGVERFAMLKYGIPDIRLFAAGDLRFINQF